MSRVGFVPFVCSSTSQSAADMMDLRAVLVLKELRAAMVIGVGMA